MTAFAEAENQPLLTDVDNGSLVLGVLFPTDGNPIPSVIEHDHSEFFTRGHAVRPGDILNGPEAGGAVLQFPPLPDCKAELITGEAITGMVTG